MDSSHWLRSLLSGDAPSAGAEFCLDKNVSYAHRVDNAASWNWCLVPDGGYDAVFFAGLAIAAMCLASPRWDALVVLFFGGIYFTFSYYYNLEHVSNAVMLWLGMRPADIFVFVFLPPFLLDLSVRIDFFMLRKVAFNIAFMAFVMVAASALLLIPFMLYALDLKSSGWTAGHVALFGSMIASTDAASVSAVLRGGGGPEILSVLLEGESLLNDASSLTLFEIFKEVVLEDAKTTLAHDLQGIVVKTIWSAFTGICIGLAMGIFTRWVFAWLQHRNMEAMAEVAWSVAGAYLSFYITQVWCKGSGCIGAVAYGLYGSSTLLWGMSTKARLTGIFTQFWAVMTFIINGLIFFYVGASSVNFTLRSAQTLFADSGGIPLVKILLYKLPLIFLASFALRFILIFVSFKLLQLVRLSGGLSIQEVIFVTVGGLRGSLSLVLAQSAATLASTHGDNQSDALQVKAEIAIYTAGYVIMTLLINAPLCGPLLTLLGLDKVRQEQLAMRGEVKNLFRKYTATAIDDLAAGQDEDELLQGLDWAMLSLHTNFDKQLDKELPEVQPHVQWFACGSYLAAPVRLVHYLVACLRGRCQQDALELETAAATLSRQRQEAELKRATNINLRDFNRVESRSSAAAQGLPTAMIIRDTNATSSSGTMHNGGHGLPSKPTSYPTSGTNGRRPPAVVGPANSSLRRSNSKRLSSLVVGPTGAAAAAAAGGGGDGEPSMDGRGFIRNSSRFLEGAVAGPAIGGGTRRSPNGFGPSMAAAVYTVRAEGSPDGDAAADAAVGERQIELVLSSSSSSKQLPASLPSLKPQPQQQPQKAYEGGGGDGGGGGEGPGDGGEREEDDKRGEAAAAAIILSPVVCVAAATSTAPAAGSAASTATAAAVPQLSLRIPQASGGDSMIDAALQAAGSAVAAAVEAGPGVVVMVAESPTSMLRHRSSSLGPISPRAVGGAAAIPSGPRVPIAAVRSSLLSRVTGGGGNGPRTAGLSRLHTSTSLTKLDSIGQEKQPSEAGTGAGGATSEPESESRRSFGEGRTVGEQGLLQSMIVIRPGAARGGSMLQTTSLGPSASVRLVQRLGDDNGRSSGLEELRAEALAAPGGRALGRSSVRLAGPAAMPALGEFLPPLAGSESQMSMAAAPWPGPVSAADRPLGRTSASVPATGRPLGRSSGVFPAMIERGNLRYAGLEHPSLSPFEFALPEDLPGGPSLVEPFHPLGRGGGLAAPLGRASVRQGPADGGAGGGGLGRASIRASGAVAATAATDGGGGGGGGGSLARPSVRQGVAAGGGGGGALGRASVRLGRQGGLAAVSTQLARIYDADGASTAAAAAAAAAAATDGSGLTGRPSLVTPLESPSLPHPRASITCGPSPASALPGPHIALQVPGLQQREPATAMAKQLSSQSMGPPQYILGAMSKGALMSLLRRSASHARSQGGEPNGAVSPGRSLSRDLSTRGPELGRRTRFVDANTAAALTRASGSGTFRQPSSELDGGSGGAGGGASSAAMCDTLLVEYRLRLLTGLKQYYKQKHAAGSLSPSSYKILSYIADQSAHHPEHPLSLWTMAKREISSGPVMEVEVALYFKLKQWTAAAKASSVTLIRTVVPRLLVPFVRMISSHTAAATLRGLETAVELWASLTQSLQTEWLQYSGLYGDRLLDEVQHEADGAWAYIIERRIEAPKKFGAVQTHRAVIDVLTQQQAFVKGMNEGGMIEESECRKIMEMVEKRLQLLARRGPRWRQPTVMEILKGTAVLRGVPPKVVEWIRKNSTFRVYPQGAAIWDLGRHPEGAEPDGLIIVIRGVVRMMLQQEGALVPYYLGAGGVGGLVTCVLESHVPGMSSAAAYAEGNALGKGPLVMHVPWHVLQVLKRLSREEALAPFQTLDLQMYRTAAVYVLDLLRQQVLQQFSAFIRSSLLTILSSERLDGLTVRRQRIRLLLQPAAADHIVDGTIDWIGELLNTDLDVARQLLEPPGNGNAHAGTGNNTHHHYSSLHHHQYHYNHHQKQCQSGSNHSNHSSLQQGYPGNRVSYSGGGAAGAGAGASAGGIAADDDSAGGGGAAGGAALQATGHPRQPHQQQQQAFARLVASPWVEMMYKAIAAATGSVLEVIRTSLKDSILVVLSPKQGIVQRSTMVLIQGSLEPAPIADANGGGGGPFVASSNELHVAPSVMVWVSDFFEGELVAQKELRVVAGPRGATLLLWGVKPEDLLLPSPKGDLQKGEGATAAPPVASEPRGKAAAGAGGGGGGGGGSGESDSGRSILTMAKSVAMRVRPENAKGKPEGEAAATAAGLSRASLAPAGAKAATANGLAAGSDGGREGESK